MIFRFYGIAWLVCFFHHCRCFSCSVLGKWKNECPNMQILSAIGVRSKVYSLETISEDEYDSILQTAEGEYEIRPKKKSNLKRCKGVKRHLVQKRLRHKDFRDAVLEKRNLYVDFYSINSKNHRVSTFKQRKLGLSGFYDKRFVLDW